VTASYKPGTSFAVASYKPKVRPLGQGVSSDCSFAPSQRCERDNQANPAAQANALHKRLDFSSAGRPSSAPVAGRSSLRYVGAYAAPAPAPSRPLVTPPNAVPPPEIAAVCYRAWRQTIASAAHTVMAARAFARS
jgi:hypothetical protein